MEFPKKFEKNGSSKYFHQQKESYEIYMNNNL